jgi:uncharacterized protein with HEPN domain
MQLDVRQCLFDIQQGCHLLGVFTAGKTFTDYSSDPLLRSAIERQFEIIGEALNQMLKLEKQLISRVSDCQRIIAFRNRLIPGYVIVSNQMLWDIIETTTGKRQRSEGRCRDEQRSSLSRTYPPDQRIQLVGVVR